MVLACLTLAILTGLVRQASQTIDVFEIVFFRNLIGVILLAPMLFRGGIPSALRQRWPLFASRGIISFAAILTWFYALAHVPLADAVTLNFTLPLFATVLAALILHETVHVRRWTATVVGFLGAVIVLRPGFSEVGSGAIAALGSAAFMAMSMTMVKIMSRIDKPSTIVLWSNLVMTPAVAGTGPVRVDMAHRNRRVLAAGNWRGRRHCPDLPVTRLCGGRSLGDPAVRLHPSAVRGPGRLCLFR